MEKVPDQVQEAFWRRVKGEVELVYEEGTYNTVSQQNQDRKASQIFGVQKLASHYKAHSENEPFPESEVLSREIIGDCYSCEAENQPDTSIESGFICDENNNLLLTFCDRRVPTIRACITESRRLQLETLKDQSDFALYAELMLCEKSSIIEREKYKVIRKGLKGNYRKKLAENGSVIFQDLYFKSISNPDKNSRLFLRIFRASKGKERIYQQIIVSREIFILEPNKVIFLGAESSLQPYVELFPTEFMERPPPSVRLNKQDKRNYNQEINSFEKYLLKKNKKVLNMLYLSFKYPHFVELLFRSNGMQEKLKCLSNSLKIILNASQDTSQDVNEGKFVCNHFNPQCLILMKIKVNMRRSRFLMRNNITRYLSVVADDTDQQYPGYLKLDSIREIKAFYIDFYHEISHLKTREQSLTYSNPPVLLDTVPIRRKLGSKESELHEPGYEAAADGDASCDGNSRYNPDEEEQFKKVVSSKKLTELKKISPPTIVKPIKQAPKPKIKPFKPQKNEEIKRQPSVMKPPERETRIPNIAVHPPNLIQNVIPGVIPNMLPFAGFPEIPDQTDPNNRLRNLAAFTQELKKKKQNTKPDKNGAPTEPMPMPGMFPMPGMPGCFTAASPMGLPGIPTGALPDGLGNLQNMGIMMMGAMPGMEMGSMMPFPMMAPNILQAQNGQHKSDQSAHAANQQRQPGQWQIPPEFQMRLMQAQAQAQIQAHAQIQAQVQAKAQLHAQNQSQNQNQNPAQGLNQIQSQSQNAAQHSNLANSSVNGQNKVDMVSPAMRQMLVQVMPMNGERGSGGDGEHGPMDSQHGPMMVSPMMAAQLMAMQRAQHQNHQQQQQQHGNQGQNAQQQQQQQQQQNFQNQQIQFLIQQQQQQQQFQQIQQMHLQQQLKNQNGQQQQQLNNQHSNPNHQKQQNNQQHIVSNTHQTGSQSQDINQQDQSKAQREEGSHTTEREDQNKKNKSSFTTPTPESFKQKGTESQSKQSSQENNDESNKTNAQGKRSFQEVSAPGSAFPPNLQTGKQNAIKPGEVQQMAVLMQQRPDGQIGIPFTQEQFSQLMASQQQMSFLNSINATQFAMMSQTQNASDPRHGSSSAAGPMKKAGTTPGQDQGQPKPLMSPFMTSMPPGVLPSGLIPAGMMDLRSLGNPEDVNSAMRMLGMPMMQRPGAGGPQMMPMNMGFPGMQMIPAISGMTGMAGMSGMPGIPYLQAFQAMQAAQRNQSINPNQAAQNQNFRNQQRQEAAGASQQQQNQRAAQQQNHGGQTSQPKQPGHKEEIEKQ